MSSRVGCGSSGGSMSVMIFLELVQFALLWCSLHFILIKIVLQAMVATIRMWSEQVIDQGLRSGL